jgi:hypothetical protein
MKSWKPEVQTGTDPKWYDNALRFATEDEAKKSARNLMDRWLLVVDCRAVESDDPVNYKWVDGEGLQSL